MKICLYDHGHKDLPASLVRNDYQYRSTPGNLAGMHTRGKKIDAPAFLLGICMVYILFRPVSASNILYPLLGVMGIVGAWLVISRRRQLHRMLKATAGVAFFVAILGLFIGANNPGFMNGLLTWAIAPAVYWIWATALSRQTLRTVLYASALGTILLSGTIILYVGAQAGFLPDILPRFILEESGAGFDGSGESTAIRLYGLSSLAAAAPMWVASLLVRKHPLLPGLFIRISAGAMSTAAALMAGRSAIVVVVTLTPLVVWGLRMLMRRRDVAGVRIPGSVLVAGLITIALAPVLIPIASSYPAVRIAWAAAVDLVRPSGTTPDGYIRQEQTTQLFRGLDESPWFGHGFGATLESGYSRSDARPWDFEMQYHLLGFQVGVIGFALMTLVVVFTLIAARNAALRRAEMVPVLVVTGAAAIGMLIANATNPYLQAPGHMWAVFIFIGAINATLTGSRSSHAVTQGTNNRPE